MLIDGTRLGALALLCESLNVGLKGYGTLPDIALKRC